MRKKYFIKKFYKSNIILMVLLFVFLLPAFSFISWPVADTIIIDGDTIYIEKRLRRVNLDSLQEKSTDDITKKRINQHRFSLGIDLSVNQTVSTFGSVYKSLIPLDNFVERNKSRVFNFSSGIDLGLVVWKSPLKTGELQVSLHTGLRYNEIKTKSTTLDETNFDRDSLIQLDFVDNLLLLEYFTIFDTTDMGIIGELDTATIDLGQSVKRFQTWDFPFRIRASFRPTHSKFSIFGEVGVLYRRISPYRQVKNNLYLVNAQADLFRFNSINFQPRNVLIPMFSIGGSYNFIQKDLQERHWSLSTTVTGCMPSRALNPEGIALVNSKNYMISISLIRTL